MTSCMPFKTCIQKQNLLSVSALQSIWYAAAYQAPVSPTLAGNNSRSAGETFKAGRKNSFLHRNPFKTKYAYAEDTLFRYFPGGIPSICLKKRLK